MILLQGLSPGARGTHHPVNLYHTSGPKAPMMTWPPGLTAEETCRTYASRCAGSVTLS
jgi:hypothetical protein